MYNVYSRCNEILSNYPSDHVSTPRILSTIPRSTPSVSTLRALFTLELRVLLELEEARGETRRSDGSEGRRVSIREWRTTRWSAAATFSAGARIAWHLLVELLDRDGKLADPFGGSERVRWDVAWHATEMFAGNTRPMWIGTKRRMASSRLRGGREEGAVRAPPHRFTLRALVQACLCQRPRIADGQLRKLSFSLVQRRRTFSSSRIYSLNLPRYYPRQEN